MKLAMALAEIALGVMLTALAARLVLLHVLKLPKSRLSYRGRELSLCGNLVWSVAVLISIPVAYYAGSWLQSSGLGWFGLGLGIGLGLSACRAALLVGGDAMFRASKPGLARAPSCSCSPCHVDRQSRSKKPSDSHRPRVVRTVHTTSCFP